ncbi:uncharacterized protein LOC106155927 [Lingula anatina]|uniref:Uncharacterized protein LOC106155927 n=1 Tax=Lingula anatina TaxID=7574 RepID=A0A1S3HJX7_LINAN|nr:uncharacterized protein LOC106155927 [Lingula anatina]|eukprot:XP_013386423.1 uncharacterized protein LOC106155927 [Lingula anatina]
MKKALLLTIAIVIIAFLIRNSEVCHPAAVIIPVMTAITTIAVVSIATAANQNWKKGGGRPPPGTPDHPPYVLTCPPDRFYTASRGRTTAYTSAEFVRATYGSPPERVQGPELGGALAEGVYKIVYRGNDAQGKPHDCSFTVTVSVTRCPSNMTAPEHGEMECDPPGNIYGTQCNFRCSKQGYALVIPGETRDISTARTECTANGTWSENISPVCVHRCPDIPPPGNGYVSCTGNNKIICRAYCNPGYDNAMFYQTDRGFYWCSTDDGVWKPSLTIPPCSKMPDDFLGLFHTSTFNVSCNDNSSLAKLKESMIAELPTFLKDEYQDVIENFTVRINCSKNERKKRSLQELVEHQRINDSVLGGTGEGTAQVTIEVLVKRIPTASGFERRQTLYGIFSALNRATETASSNVGISKISRSKYGIDIQCKEGTVKSDINLACIACPQGTYYNSTSKVCTLCPLGSYQNESGQTSCKTCPNGETTLLTGSKQNDDCIKRRIWGPWTAWGECSVTCGGGHKMRTRSCVTDAEFCPTPGQVEKKPCNTELCRSCVPLVAPNNSALQCQKENDATTCSLTCADGYGFSSPVLEKYTCGPLTAFLWPHQTTDNPNGTLPNCAELKENDLQFYLQTEFPLPRPITCDSPEYSDAAEQIKTHFDTFVGSSICHQAQLCSFQPPKIIECIVAPDNATSKLTVGSHGKYLGTDVKSREAKQVYDEMVKLGQDFKSKVENGEIGIIIDGQFIPPDISSTQATGGRGCPLGSIFTSDFSACVECQPGTFYMDPKQCFLCDIGFYQPNQGQLDCIQCPSDTSTKTRGASSISECLPIKACVDPGVPQHGERYGDEFNPGRTVYFKCDDGFRMVGKPSLKCMDSGVWSGSTPRCARGVALSCGFEEGDLCGFRTEQIRGNADWTRTSNLDFPREGDDIPLVNDPAPTPRGKYFIYLNYSGEDSYDTLSARASSPIVERSSSQCLEFHFSAGVKTHCAKKQKAPPSLSIKVQDWVSKNQTELWKYKVSTFISWRTMVIPLPQSFEAYQVQIEGSLSNDPQMFLAVDDVIVRACTQDDDTSGAVSGRSGDVISSCNFDWSFCSWKDSQYWKIVSSDPHSPQRKIYAALTNQETRSTFVASNLVSENITGNSDFMCIRFKYIVHSFSRLTLLVRMRKGPNSYWSFYVWSDCILTMNWQLGPNSVTPWREAEVTIRSPGQAFQLVFSGVLFDWNPRLHEIGLDDVTVSRGACV